MDREVNLRRLTMALDLAVRAHEGQRRGHGRHGPYINHVADVARRVAESLDADEVTVLGALLHDVVEKTSHGLDEIRETFGEEVASVVAELTDDPDVSGREAHRRQVEGAPSLSSHAKRVRLADKASKLAEIAATPPHWWDRRRVRRQVEKARTVVARLRGTDPTLEAAFDREDEAVTRALGCGDSEA